MSAFCPYCAHAKTLHTASPDHGGVGCTQALVGDCHPIERCACTRIFDRQCAKCDALMEQGEEHCESLNPKFKCIVILPLTGNSNGT